MAVDPSLILGGDSYLSYSLDYLATAAAGIRFGENPDYELDDFLEMYPQFGPSDGVWPVPEVVLTVYLNLASACLAYERWQDSWAFAMGLFIAHYATLYLQSSASVGDSKSKIASAGISKGIQASKSVGDVSVSYQMIVTGWESWGAWNLTLFGQQFITMAQVVGMGPVYVW